MDIVCDKCRSRFRIPDEKISAGRVGSFLCPKCKNRISVSSSQKTDDALQDVKKDETSNDEIAPDTYDASEKPFDFIEEEGKTVLVCEPDPAIMKKVTSALNIMEYLITEAKNYQDALKKMRYHLYDLILVNEDFDTNNPDANSVLIYLERLNTSTRRNMFVAMISRRFRTMDNMMAFNKSVNMIINIKNIDDIDKILSRGISDNNFFYKLYKDTLLKETGRI